MTSTLRLLAAGPFLVACVAPPGVLATTRTPRAGSFAGGAAAEYPIAASPRTNVQPIERGIFIVRPRGWVAYGLTERLAVSVTVPIPTMAGQLALQWNPLRTRYLDVAVVGRAGLEWCADGGSFAFFGDGETGICRTGIGPADEWYGHASAVGLLGLNPASWLTVQAQGGVGPSGEPPGAAGRGSVATRT